MIERDVLVGTKHGQMHAFAVCPDGGGPYPPVIFYMDAPGYREELKNMARRIARAGYYCLLPDLYYRLGTVRFDLHRRDESLSSVIRAARNTLTNAMIAEDTAGMLAFLDAQEEVKPGPVGCVGHCMSGRFIVTVAARFPERIAAAAAFYGVQIVTDQPDSPHLIADRIKGEVYLSFAEVDELVPANVVPDITAIFDKAGVRHDVEVVPGTHHGYCFAERAAYHAAASEAAWGKLFAMWKRRLK
ncbi:carboxymethylenebutenolidase [Constrictibacter sp. MBR-5]|uniref:dienelactone hydrolase family protein n=1 Tax=Constrictibacter sp. MBR-5 TaxID=3156467 RepID=UPI003390D158